jgi:hypothetical protein
MFGFTHSPADQNVTIHRMAESDWQPMAFAPLRLSSHTLLLPEITSQLNRNNDKSHKKNANKYDFHKAPMSSAGCRI